MRSTRTTARRWAVALGCAVLLMWGATGAAPKGPAPERAKPKAPAAKRHKATKDPLLGRWRATEIERKGSKKPVPSDIELLAEFDRGGRFVSVFADSHHGRRERVGTWKRVKPDTVVTVVRKRTDRMVYSVSRGNDRLVLTNPESGQRLFLKRVK